MHLGSDMSEVHKFWTPDFLTVASDIFSIIIAGPPPRSPITYKTVSVKMHQWEWESARGASVFFENLWTGGLSYSLPFPLSVVIISSVQVCVISFLPMVHLLLDVQNPLILLILPEWVFKF